MSLLTITRLAAGLPSINDDEREELNRILRERKTPGRPRRWQARPRQGLGRHVQAEEERGHERQGQEPHPACRRLQEGPASRRPAGAEGDQGPKGDPGVAHLSVMNRQGPWTDVPAMSTVTAKAQCQPGEVATGGGPVGLDQGLILLSSNAAAVPTPVTWRSPSRIRPTPRRTSRSRSSARPRSPVSLPCGIRGKRMPRLAAGLSPFRAGKSPNPYRFCARLTLARQRPWPKVGSVHSLPGGGA